MKAKRTAELKGFKPVTIEVTIETEEELAELWHRISVGQDDIRRFCVGQAGWPQFPRCKRTGELFDVLDEIVVENNKRKKDTGPEGTG